MRVVLFPQVAGHDRRLGRRATGFIVVALVHLLLALLLLTIAPKLPLLPPMPKTFTLSPIRALNLEKKPVVQAKHAHVGAPPRKAPSQTMTKTVAVPKSDQPSTKPFTTELMDAVDIAALPNHKNDTTSATDGTGIGPGRVGAGNESGSLYSANGAPGGEPLYNAEWVTEPTRAELATYLPRTLPTDSWGVIACRTVERNRVEDCQELGDSQPGLGLARAMRQAAFQFHVRPPRVGGKVLVGSWVRIRIDEHIERAER